MNLWEQIRERFLSPLYRKRFNISPVQIEEELTLRFDKDELFDPHVVLPHMEVNRFVYKTVDWFVDRYGGERLTLTIYSSEISESSRQIFRESFVSHYEDEYRRATLLLHRWYLRVVILILIGVSTYYVGMKLEASIKSLPFLITAIANISLFCIWEICNTDFKRRDTILQRKKIQRARDAEIRFRSRPTRKKAKKPEDNTGSRSEGAAEFRGEAGKTAPG